MSRHVLTDGWYWFGDRAWRVNARVSGLLTHILRPLLAIYEATLDRHSKVFVYRFDLRVPEHTVDNKVVGDLMRRLNKRIKSHYKVSHVAYLWVREKERAKRQHYHIALFLDGHRVRHPYQINQWIDHYSGLFDLSPHYAGYHNIRRDRPDYELSLQAAGYHISYLAKARGKGYRSPQTKDFGHSRVR